MPSQVHVITTTYRPVPLEHHLVAGNELYPVSEMLVLVLAFAATAAR